MRAELFPSFSAMESRIVYFTAEKYMILSDVFLERLDVYLV